MINRVKWSVCSVLVILLQSVLPLISTAATDKMPAGRARMTSEPSLSKKGDESRQETGNLDLSRKQSLVGLVGVAEISVLADVDGQFVRNMAEYRVLDVENASQVEESNLLESVDAGRTFSRDSHAALARTEQAKAQTGQTLALLLPHASVRANRGYETSEPAVEVDAATGELISSDTHIRSDVVFTVTQPLFNLSSFLDWRRSKVKQQASEESYRVSDGDAYVSTINAYLYLVSTRLQADVARDFEAQLAELLNYIEKRAGAGAASVSDMARVRARREAILSSQVELESAHRAAGTEFVRLTNLAPQKIRLPVLEDVGASILPKSFDAAMATAMKLNPEIAALTAEVEAEKISISAAKGRFLPRVDAEYTDTYSQHAGGSDSDQRDRRYMMVLNWNLFSGGKDYNFNKERTARHEELLYRLDGQRRRVAQDLSANYAALESTGERIDLGYLEMKSISTASDAMSKRMLSGNQSLLDLLDVYNQRYLVRSRLVDLHVFEMNTVAQLVRLTQGTPWPVSEGNPIVPE